MRFKTFKSLSDSFVNSVFSQELNLLLCYLLGEATACSKLRFSSLSVLILTSKTDIQQVFNNWTLI